MLSNSTDSIPLKSLAEVIVVYIFFLLSVAGTIVLSVYIISIIHFTKTLRSPANLLVSNTCLASILYVIISTINVTCFVMEITLSDWVCRVQGYLSYVSLTIVGYSYVIQSVSRLFFTVLSRYRVMRGYSVHRILIVSQIIFSFLIPMPSLVTQVIVYEFQSMCFIPSRFILHVAYFFASSYFVPLFTVIFIYVIIYRRVTSSSRTVENRSRSNKRDLQLVRNILLLFTIFLLSGVPAILDILIYKITSWKSPGFYLFTVGSPALASMVEKTSLIVLNRELRAETRKKLRRLCGDRLFGQIEVEPFSMGAVTINRTLGSTTTALRK